MKHWLTFFVVSTAMLSPNTAALGQTKTKAAAGTEAKADQEDKKEMTVLEQISQLISDKELAEAAKLVDSLDQNSREASRFRTQLATDFLRSRNYVGAVAQHEAQLQVEMAKKNFSSGKIAVFVVRLTSCMPRAKQSHKIMPMIDNAIELVSTKVDPAKASIDMESLMRINVAKSSALRSDDQLEEAKSILQRDLDQVQKLHAEEDSAMSARLYSSAMLDLLPALTDTDVRNEMLASHQDLASKLAEKGNVDMAVVFVQAALSEIGRSYRSDPVAAEEILKSLKEFVSHHSENEKIAARLKPYERRLASYESRLESSKKLLAMIGQPAPAMDADVIWVGVEQPIDTDGKVVLLDFWAIWCGPCINTFPHLKHLTEEYGDKGFQVSGVTRYYNYTWDEEAGRPLRGDRAADPNPEAENEALQKFLASHSLTHPTVVTPEGSTMNSDFGVSGIPHVALLDQQGRIQMVKVGSGKANAQAIEAKIKELLGLTKSKKSASGE